MDVARKIFYSVCVCVSVFLLVGSRVCAGIFKSPHDIVSWFKTDKVKAGICAYCHVPHSAKGDRLFPEQSSTEVAKYGPVAGLCAKCHVNNYTQLGGLSMVVDNEIFATLDKVKHDSTMDSHPTKGTNTSTQSNALQDTKLDTVFALEWPWLAGWGAYGATKPAGLGDIECSTCHNPHQWNGDAYGSTAQRKFLRAPVYDPDGPTGRKNFCSWCHKNREDSKRGPSSGNSGTHPVADGTTDGARFANCATGSCYKDTDYMIMSFADADAISDSPDSRQGLAVFDLLESPGRFIGARLYSDGETIICQSCHMPHGVMHSDDDVYWDTGTAELRVGPLLAINNATNWGRLKPDDVSPDIEDWLVTSETAYIVPTSDPAKEENLLCEWCHGMTPDLESAAEGVAAFAHPVNAYPTNEANKGTSDNQPSEDGHGFGGLHIKYPNATWYKYRESSGIRGAFNTQKNPAVEEANKNLVLTGGTNRGTGNYLICLSCHEPHNADTTNGYLLKKGSGTDPADGSFCDGCHENVAMGVGTVGDIYFTTWTTHPSGTDARLVNTDGGTLPNRAGLRVFDAADDRGGYVSCWTCHKGHKGVEKPVLADYQTEFSQICVNCHCEGDTDVRASSKDANWVYGTGDNATNANPSKYYKEGAWPTWWGEKTSDTQSEHEYAVESSERMGSHYIGQFTKVAVDRPEMLTGSKGWLGERNADRETDKSLRSIKHYDTSTSEKDNWLETTRFIDTTWPGSGQKSHIGDIGGSPETYVTAADEVITTTAAVGCERVLICQSCHAVHNSAIGVADGAGVSRLLLASNYDSYMCRRCHIPEPTVEGKKTNSHPMSVPVLGTAFTYNTAVTDVLTGGKRLVNTDGSHFAYNYPDDVVAPANYPPWIDNTAPVEDDTGTVEDESAEGVVNHRMTCDACHTAHNAQSKMGALITEGPDAAYLTAVVSNVSGNKVPKFSERDDKPTCDLCHKQGK